MKDSFTAGVIRNYNITVGVASTTDTCREAQRIHRASELATIALGRLLSAATLATFSQSRKGQLSLQVVSQGVLGNVFTDVTDAGHIRTMIKNPQATLPRLLSDGATQRRTLTHAFRDGQLGVIWQPEGRSFSQSTTPLVSGEIDQDVEHFLAASDQVRTVLWADVQLGADGTVLSAGGVLLQAMPDADFDEFNRLGGVLRQAAESVRLPYDLEGLSTLLDEELTASSSPVALQWQCRCSYDRVMGGLRMLGVEDLADMVQKNETAQVTCEFCGKHYEVPPPEVRTIYEEKVQPGN
ncbi:MAG: Hsp33 family molecular chaperone HslO [Myxococcota bacterium]